MVDYLSDKGLDWPNRNYIIIGQDSNTKIRMREPIDVDKISENNIRLFKDPKSDKKGRNLLDFIRSNNWFGG